MIQSISKKIEYGSFEQPGPNQEHDGMVMMVDGTTISTGVDCNHIGDGVATSVDDDHDESFYYLTTGHHKHYQEEQTTTTTHKCWRMITPVLVAFILMGGIAYALSQYFNTLYPNDRVPSNMHSTSTSIATSNKDSQSNHTTVTDAQESTIKAQYRYPECSLYHKCAGLEGLCCPTRDGKFLDCCH